MSEYDDLVKRLLSGAEDPMWAAHCEISKKTAIQAADAITQLQARVAELEKELQEIWDVASGFPFDLQEMIDAARDA